MREISIGLLGHGFMGRVHSYAYRAVQHKFRDFGFIPRLYILAGLGDEQTQKASEQYGFEKWTTDWKKLVNDPQVDVVDICLPEDMHYDVCIEAIKAGKHVFCEKPLALDGRRSRLILDAIQGSKIKTMCGFNYRFLPAVRFTKEIIEKGLIGEIYCIRASYSQESGHDPNRPADQIRYINGTEPLGAIKGIGSHLLDITRYLCGEINAVSAIVKTVIPVRPLSGGGIHTVTVDDMAVLNVKMENGAIGSLIATAMAPGRKNHLTFEINASKGSIVFDLENLNNLSVYLADGPINLRGFSKINVTGSDHPFTAGWWPPAHILGWESGHINQLCHFLNCICKDQNIGPLGATFEDGYKAALIADAAIYSSGCGKEILISEENFGPEGDSANG